MIKLWAKIITDDKIVKDIIFERFENYSRENFFDVLVDICYELDIPTPVLLLTHLENLEQFNNIKFVERDFVEKIYFDKLIIENAIE